MIFNTTAEYAIRGVAELAVRSDGQSSLMMDDLVAGTDLPRDFLAKVFQKLVKGGILKSMKGRGGGFQLARAGHDITLLQIVDALEGPQVFDACVVGLSRCNDQMPCPQHDLYKPIRQRLKDYLTTTTVADLASSLKSKESWQRLRLEQGKTSPAT